MVDLTNVRFHGDYFMVYKPTFTSLRGPIPYGIYPLVNVDITNWNITMLFSWVNPLFRLGHGWKKTNRFFTRDWMGTSWDFTMNSHETSAISMKSQVVSIEQSHTHGNSWWLHEHLLDPMAFFAMNHRISDLSWVPWDFNGISLSFPWEYQEASKDFVEISRGFWNQWSFPVLTGISWEHVWFNCF